MRLRQIQREARKSDFQGWNVLLSEIEFNMCMHILNEDSQLFIIH